MRTLADPEELRLLLERLARLRPDSPRQWGRMSPHQMLCHLSDSYLAGLGERSVSSTANLFSRTVMRWGGLWFPLTWPKNIATRPEMEQGSGGTPPTEFEQDRKALAEVMVRFCRQKQEFPWASHPIFGAMTAREWLRWGYLHADHHFRQFRI